MLANIEEIDESIYSLDEDYSPHTPEIIAHAYNQLSIEQFNAMSNGEDQHRRLLIASLLPSLPIFEP